MDALSAVQLIGYGDRQLLKDSLGLVLPKTLDEKAAFDTCFDQFFSYRARTSLRSPTPPSAQDAATADRGDNTRDRAAEANDGTENRETEAGDGTQAGNSSAGSGEARGERSGRGQSSEATAAAREARESSEDVSPGEMPAPQSPLSRLLTRANSMEINIAINAAGQQVNVYQIELFTQKGVYTRRILEAMGHTALQEEIFSLSDSAAIPDRRLAQDLTRRRDWLRERIREYVEHQFLLHADVSGRRLRESLLRDLRLSSVEQRHHRLLRDLVQRMARKLVAAYSRRRKVFRRGHLHVPRTLRRNMKYDDAIFDLHWKSVKTDQPKVFAICDVSGSVANYARFMLMFLYSLEEVLPKVRSFAFSSDLGEITDLFARNDIDTAIALALRQYGSGSTDYGQALADFRKLCLDDLDRRTTVIILGDARNNYGDARTDVLKEIYDRARRVLWLNPEPRAIWDTGDSEMRHYIPYCHQAEECGTLAQLARVVDRLLRIGL
ncbi:VWA domain-containing protein [Steroidobacter sp. S1-65]|uniref:VWA domain-containing protein n=1 Tax=Steroidobacter gossypii TaxID=2805490 RepID=A0ABS1WR75_9GAMM|nr:VWA domain-containing protein [Steroidobacter gossypii]MBM0103463.1 VWA domain-containing protein [Steroidobacter gossypii]